MLVILKDLRDQTKESEKFSAVFLNPSKLNDEREFVVSQGNQKSILNQDNGHLLFELAKFSISNSFDI